MYVVVDERENSLAGKQTRTTQNLYTTKAGADRAHKSQMLRVQRSIVVVVVHGPEHLTRSFQVLGLVVSAGEATAGDGDRDPHMPVRADSAAAAAARGTDPSDLPACGCARVPELDGKPPAR